MHNYSRKIIIFLLPVIMYCPLLAHALDVRITQDIESVEVNHAGKKVTIVRNQEPGNIINPDYAKTARKCPPFCIQPMVIAKDVETIGELEMLDYLQRSSRG
ncbi:MAG: rhodanese-like domain-containing protein, partial [Gammaproteobacteria bacterium]